MRDAYERTRELEPNGRRRPPASDDVLPVECPNHGIRIQLTRNQIR